MDQRCCCSVYGGKSGWTRGAAVLSMVGLREGSLASVRFAVSAERANGDGRGQTGQESTGGGGVFRRACGEVAKSMGCGESGQGSTEERVFRPA